MILSSSDTAGGRRQRTPCHGLEPGIRRVLVAGSRHGRVSRQACAELIHHVSIHGYTDGMAPATQGLEGDRPRVIPWSLSEDIALVGPPGASQLSCFLCRNSEWPPDMHHSYP